jgi:general secretion pathway protein G
MVQWAQRLRFLLLCGVILAGVFASLAGIAVPAYSNSIRHAREAVLKEDLHVLREAIRSYTIDKKRGPGSLGDLIREGYLKSIPEDPMTHANDTWVSGSSTGLRSLNQPDPGIDDIQSGSDETGSDGQSYNNW